MRIPYTLIVALMGFSFLAVAAAAGEKGDPKRGEKLFRACRACHTVKAGGGNIVGPNLHGLFGRRAGSVKSYRYSEALRKADLVWTEETVDELFRLGPDVFTPGSKMPLQAMSNPKDRADLIAYLKKAAGAHEADK